MLMSNNLQPIIDMHVHLRSEPAAHLKILAESGIDEVVAMANTSSVLDDVDKIIAYRQKCQGYGVKANLASAISKNLMGRELVNIRELKKHVVGFSDDGKCLINSELLAKAWLEDILILAHLEPETEMLEKYIFVLKKAGRGRLHCQHISRKSSVDLLRKYKHGLPITAETCPHYLYLNSEIDDLAVNPPVGTEQDRVSLLGALSDGTIDCISSDYAPLPRITGIAGARMFLPLCQGLVANGILTKEQLKEKICLNPQKIIKNRL